jgi:hypothetical protein
MLKLKNNQKGLIPLLVCILGVVAALIYFAFIRVAKIKH